MENLLTYLLIETVTLSLYTLLHLKIYIVGGCGAILNIAMTSMYGEKSRSMSTLLSHLTKKLQISCVMERGVGCLEKSAFYTYM